MKHTWTVTIIIVLMFLTAQVVGLYLINLSTNVIENKEGVVQIEFTETALVERPQIQGTQSVIFIVIAVAVGTLLLLFLAKKSKVNWWKAWFILAVWLTLTISLGVVLHGSDLFPAILALALTLWKIYKPNIFIHNITEILTYSGIAVLLAPILNIITGIIILILFSIYDAYAVWKSKHMITLAKFTTKANLFPGLSIPYSVKEQKTHIHTKIEKKETEPPKPPKDEGPKTGLLGGGDVVFPLIFAGVVMIELINSGVTKQEAYFLSLIVVLGALASLLFLFWISKKDKFYPAMPYLTTGCLLGYGVMLLVLL